MLLKFWISIQEGHERLQISSSLSVGSTSFVGDGEEMGGLDSTDKTADAPSNEADPDETWWYVYY